LLRIYLIIKIIIKYEKTRLSKSESKEVLCLKSNKNYLAPKYLPKLNNYVKEDNLEEELSLLQIS